MISTEERSFRRYKGVLAFGLSTGQNRVDNVVKKVYYSKVYWEFWKIDKILKEEFAWRL